MEEEEEVGIERRGWKGGNEWITGFGGGGSGGFGSGGGAFGSGGGAFESEGGFGSGGGKKNDELIPSINVE